MNIMKIGKMMMKKNIRKINDIVCPDRKIRFGQ